MQLEDDINGIIRWRRNTECAPKRVYLARKPIKLQPLAAFEIVAPNTRFGARSSQRGIFQFLFLSVSEQRLICYRMRPVR